MKIIEREFNAITGETTDTERDETAAETKARLELEKANTAAQADANAKAIQKAALLEKLGISESEAALLLS
jgi:hypothetical protein